MGQIGTPSTQKRQNGTPASEEITATQPEFDRRITLTRKGRGWTAVIESERHQGPVANSEIMSAIVAMKGAIRGNYREALRKDWDAKMEKVRLDSRMGQIRKIKEAASAA